MYLQIEMKTETYVTFGMTQHGNQFSIVFIYKKRINMLFKVVPNTTGRELYNII